jgi:hypothetical protein
LAFVVSFALPAFAGPPYVTDDPEPTDYKHFEIYLFADGTITRNDNAGQTGVDFNYGAAPNLQLTAVLPLAYDRPADGTRALGRGNIELAAKVRLLHQESFGWDVSVFPRIFLSSPSSAAPERHSSLLLPIWLEKDWNEWATFGGGGCVLHPGGAAKNSCLMGWAVTRQVLPRLQLGAELSHQTADSGGKRASTGIGAGARYDVSEHLHLVGSIGPGIQHSADTNQYSWYAALLMTF